jgi:diguanylate cyclase (GGDEF)-like protein/PAS domain S-box-containing protein
MNSHAWELPKMPFMRQHLLKMVLVAGLYVLLAKGTLVHFALADGNVSLVWPSRGLALAALLIGGRKYALAVFLGGFATSFLQGSPIHIALIVGMGGAMSSLVAHQFLSSDTLFNRALQRPRDYLSLTAAAALSATVSSSVGVTALWSVGVIPALAYWPSLLNWWQGDTLGMLLVTPFVLVWQRRPKNWFSSIPRTLETLSCFGLLVLTGQVEFMDLFSQFIGSVDHLHPTYLFVAWAAVRYGRRGVTLVIILTAVQALVGAAHGTGVFAHDFEQTHMANFWLYAMSLSTVGISLALSIAHRKQAELQLRQSEAFKETILNSVAAQIAVIDGQGVIQVVNERWQQAAVVNSPEPGKPTPNTGVGTNYLAACHAGAAADADSLTAYGGIHAVLQGRLPSFSLEYPCHTPQQQRWFNMIVTPLRQNTLDGATIMHTDITPVKQVQENLRQSYAAIQSILDTTLDGYWCTDLQGHLLDVNPSYCRLSGYSREELLTMSISDLEAIESPEDTAQHIARLMACGQDQFESQHRRKDGSLWPVEISTTFNDKLYSPSFFVFSRDITRRKRLLERLTQSENHMRAVFDTALDAVISMDADGRIIDWNTQAHTIFGWPKDEVMGKVLHDIIAPPQLRVAYRHGMARFLATGQSEVLNRRIEIMALRRSGEEFPVELSILPFKNDEVHHFTAFVADISERKRFESALQDSERKFRLIAENTSDGITIFDRNQKVQYVSPAVMTQLGYSEQDELNRSGADVYALLDPEGRDVLFQSINEAIQHMLPSMTYAYRIKHKAGHYIWREDIANFRYTTSGEYDGAYVVSRDITERKRMEEEVRQLAYFDSLTHLPNRRMLNDRLSQTMAASRRSGRYAAVMILDLDNFKPLNDQHGHLVGDILLVEVARRLIANVREVDTVARFGGDEFVVMLGDLNEDRAESRRLAEVIAEKIRESLAAPYFLAIHKENQAPTQVEHRCSASIGVALFVNHETAQDDILKWADAAMYQAKSAGRNTIRFYEAETGMV